MCGLCMCTGWGSHCLFHRNLKHNPKHKPKKPFMPDLSKLSWHLVVWRCVFLSCADWAVKTGKRRGWFSHHSETRLGKTCLMGAWEIFLGLSGETLEQQRRPVKLRTLISLSCQAVRKRRKGQGHTGPTCGTLLHTQRPHRRRADTNRGCLL